MDQNDGVAIVAELHPTRRRFQFSLRKLLLWMIVVALYLGIFRKLAQLDRAAFAIFTVWSVVVVILRTAFGQRAACLFSILAGPSFFYLSWWKYGDVTELVLGGIGYACVFFVIAECGFRVVDWADNLMGAKKDE
jgi:hypothetical protein